MGVKIYCLIVLAILISVIDGYSNSCTHSQHTKNHTAGSNTSSATFGSNNVAGNTIIAIINAGSAAGHTLTINTPTDSRNTFTKDASSFISIAATHYGTIYEQAAIATNIGAGANTVTWTVTDSGGGNASFIDLFIYEVTATGANCNLDTQSTNSNSSSNGTNIGVAITTAANGAFVVGSILIDDGFGFGSGWFSAGTGFTLGNQSGGGNADDADEWANQSTAGSITSNFTSGFSSVKGPVVTMTVDVTPAGGGGGSTCVSTMSLLGVSSCGD